MYIVAFSTELGCAYFMMLFCTDDVDFIYLGLFSFSVSSSIVHGE